VSACAFSAGLSGLLTDGLADRFDCKKLLLFFYSGFISFDNCTGTIQTESALRIKLSTVPSFMNPSLKDIDASSGGNLPKWRSIFSLGR